MFKICNHRKTSDDLRNESVRTKILSLHIIEEVLLIDLLLRRCSETYDLSIQTLCNLSLYTFKCSAADEEYVLGIHMKELLFRMFASSFRWYIYHSTFKQLEHCLLNALTRNVTGNRRIVTLARYLVYLIYEDNTSFSLRHIKICLLEQPCQYALHILSDISRLSKHCCINNRERNIEKFCY